MKNNGLTEPIHSYIFENPDGMPVEDSSGTCPGDCSEVDLVSGVEPDAGDKGVRLNGSDNSHVSFKTCFWLFGTSAFTINFWFKTTETLFAFDLIGNRADAGHGNWVSIRMYGQSNDKIPAGTIDAEVCEDKDGLNYCLVRSNVFGLNDGNWHYVSFIRDEKELRLYIDDAGVSRAKGQGIANIKSNDSFKIGRSLALTNPGQRFTPDATFANLLIFDQPIDTLELLDEYKALSLNDVAINANSTTETTDCEKMIRFAVIEALCINFAAIGIIGEEVQAIATNMYRRLSPQAIATLTSNINGMSFQRTEKDIWQVLVVMYRDLGFRGFYRIVRESVHNPDSWISIGLSLVAKIAALVAIDGNDVKRDIATMIVAMRLFEIDVRKAQSSCK